MFLNDKIVGIAFKNRYAGWNIFTYHQINCYEQLKGFS